MGEKYLGKTFDIHGGGMDLIFPHHEAEIAQSHASNKCMPVNYWMHNNMITVDGKKMGKSLGNFMNLEDFFSGNHEKLSKAYSPMTIRFFILQAHYRSTLDFGNDALQAAEKGMHKLIEAIHTLEKLEVSENSSFESKKLEEKCYSAINDDFNTPILIAHLFEGVKVVNSVKDGNASLNRIDLAKMKSIFQNFAIEILGLQILKDNNNNNLTNEVMDLILELRKNAKTNKDFNTADLIRDELEKKGIEIKDDREGSSWSLKK
jgi:cysteinyl-tRNA synthetase